MNHPYEARLAELERELMQAQAQAASVGMFLLLAVGAFLFAGLLAIRQEISFLWLLVAVPAVAAGTSRFLRQRAAQNRVWRLQRFYQQAVRRAQGEWIGEGDGGEEFAPDDHLYAKDLNVFGEGSLFELLCTARTAIGRRGLAQYLTSAPTLDEILLRQEAVKELTTRTDVREQIAVIGDFAFADAKVETFVEWLDAPVISFKPVLRIAVFLSALTVLSALLVGALGIASWWTIGFFLAPVVLFQAFVGSVFRNRVNQISEWLRPVSFETQILREGLQVLETQEFQSPKLREIVGRVQHSAVAVRRLERLLHALHERNKEWFYYPSLLLMVGTQVCMGIEEWRVKHGEPLRAWLTAWAEFEALAALGTYAFEHPSDVYPEIVSSSTCFEAKDLGHPLLDATLSVRNDVQFNRDIRFYVISGSNMSGKSTLLRSIGLNAVLAFAGAPVRARELRLSRVSIGASLLVVDSLLHGKSKFMAEVDRLRQTIEAALAGEPVLFLIDEIFSGTNSRDRRAAAEAVVRTLIAQGAIGALSTHDLALSEIACPELGGVNVHTGSKDGTDPMDFDYRLKPGVTAESNALAIARLAGVPV